MDRRRRTGLVGGLLLVLAGIWFLLVQFMPELRFWNNFSWPWIIIGAGGLILIIGLLLGEPEMAIPAAIVSGVGLILYWQNLTSQWGSWAYAWTLIPGFAGVGTIISGLLGHRTRLSLREGGQLILVSMALFIIFGSFLGGQRLIGPYWPLALILLGLVLLVQALFSGRRHSS